ncbi:MAG: aminotransferase class V-fold PLP-dependent enzyme, partial [Pirellulaceae bacterium]|nr:aminotransferase class V-fold PLP-dependent enzyme [Pirellulaceae bacterium]
IAGHKVYAPKGVGALYVRTGVSLDPVLYGAGHERGLRPGTENVPSIVGLGKAMKLAHRSLEESSERLGNLRDRLSDRLLAGLGTQALIHGEQAPRLPGTLSLVFPGVRATDLLARVPEICASTGSACHETGSGMSKTLAALGTNPQDAQGTVRLTVGWYTSEEDVDCAASSLLSAWESLV